MIPLQPHKRARLLPLGSVLVAGLLLSGCAAGASGGTPTAAPAESRAESRLVVSTDEGVLVLDAGTGETLAELPAGASPRLEQAGDGRHVYATEPGTGITRVVDSGLGAESHGDHAHPVREEPRLLPVELRHEKPTHVVVNAGHVAVYDDATGSADLYDEEGLLSGAGSDPVAVTGDGPHHGLAVPVGSGTLLTLPGGTIAGSVVRVAAGGAREGAPAECPGLHGSAIVADGVVFGCRTGLLTLGDDGTAAVTPYPSPEGRTGSFAQPSDPHARHLLGRFGEADSTKAVVLDTAAGGGIREVELGSAYRSMIDLGDGTAAVSLTDGRVAFVDLARGKATRFAAAISAWTPPEGHSGSSPALAAAGSELFLTDPAARRIVVIDTATDRVRSLPSKGTPAGIVAVEGVEEHRH